MNFLTDSRSNWRILSDVQVVNRLFESGWIVVDIGETNGDEGGGGKWRGAAVRSIHVQVYTEMN